MQQEGLTLLQSDTHLSFLHLVSLQTKCKVAALASMVPVLCTLGNLNYRNISVDFAALFTLCKRVPLYATDDK